MSSDLEEEVKGEIRKVIKKQVEDPLKGHHVLTNHISDEVGFGSRVCGSVMKQCEFLEFENDSMSSASRFRIIEEKL